MKFLGILLVSLMTILILVGWGVTTNTLVEHQSSKISGIERARQATFQVCFSATNQGGSAVLVGRRRIGGQYRYTAITAEHVVRSVIKAINKDNTLKNRKMDLMFQPDFHKQPLRLYIAFNSIDWAIPDSDWASFTFDLPMKLECATVATKKQFESIKPFDTIYAIGCQGMYGVYSRTGVIGSTHYYYIYPNVQLTSNRPWHQNPSHFFRPYVNVWFGDSGGGIFDQHGRLIGIVNAFGLFSQGTPVPHSAIAFKIHLMRPLVEEHDRNFFLIED